MRSGVIRLDDITGLAENELHHDMAEFDAAFIQRHARVLRRYALRWALAPMEMWSRRYEYPYAAEAVLEQVPEGRPGRLLDAGSGVTFFPHLLRSRREGLDVVCADADDRYAPMFRRINAERGERRVHFVPARLQAMPFKDATFDAVTCISVLEHTDCYAAILDEFHRVLAPGGLLVVTFDISLDAREQIPIEGARDLLAQIERRFAPDEPLGPMLAALDAPGELLTTDWVREVEPEKLPWAWPKLKSLYDMLHGRGWTGGFFSLAACCVKAYKGRT